MTLGEYLSLVTPFHAHRPRYMHTLAALLRPLVATQHALAGLVRDFDIDSAIGVQLDMVGLWVGRSRWLRAPVSNVFFSFDTPDVGFDQGVWLEPYMPTEHLIALDDETYRTILKLQAVANHWDGTLESIQDAFDRVFPGVAIFDHQDMSMEVIVPSKAINALELALLEQDFMLKPSGVHATWVQSTVPDEPLFGFDLDTPLIAGFDQGAWGEVIYER